MECYKPFEALAKLVDKLYKEHGERGIKAYDEFSKLVTEKGPGKYKVMGISVEVKENEICIG